MAHRGGCGGGKASSAGDGDEDRATVLEEGNGPFKVRMGTSVAQGTHPHRRRRRRVAGVVQRREPAAAQGGPTVAATWSERGSK